MPPTEVSTDGFSSLHQNGGNRPQDWKEVREGHGEAVWRFSYALSGFLG